MIGMKNLMVATGSNNMVLKNYQLQWTPDFPTLMAQKLRIRLSMFTNGWYLNPSLGLPYFTDIFIKNPSQAHVGAIIKTLILATPGVLSLLAFNVSIASVQAPAPRMLTKQLIGTFTVQISGTDQPLTVELPGGP